MKKTAAQIADYVLRKVAEDVAPLANPQEVAPLLGTRKPARVGLIDPNVERAKEQAAAKERANRILAARQAPRAGIDTPPTAAEGYEVVPKQAPLAYKQNVPVKEESKKVPVKKDDFSLDPLAGSEPLGDLFTTEEKPKVIAKADTKKKLVKPVKKK